MVTIRQVNLADTYNFRGSADLVSFAQSIGRYSPNPMWGAFNKVAPSLGLTATMPYATRPVYVVPDHKLTRQDIAAICRYQYRGTTLDQAAGYATMSPHAQSDRPICYSTTDYSAVWQLRGWLPETVGGVLWVAPSRTVSTKPARLAARSATGTTSRWCGAPTAPSRPAVPTCKPRPTARRPA